MSGGSGLCPTCSRPAGDRVGRCPTRNQTAGDWVLWVGFPSGERSVSGEAETRWKPPKRGENRRDLSRYVQDPMRSSRIWQRFCQIRCFFPPNRVQNRQIWCFGHRNLPNLAGKLVGKLELAAGCSLFERVGLNGFWRRGPETKLPTSSFGDRDPCPTTRAVGSGRIGSVRAG